MYFEISFFLRLRLLLLMILYSKLPFCDKGWPALTLCSSFVGSSGDFFLSNVNSVWTKLLNAFNCGDSSQWRVWRSCFLCFFFFKKSHQLMPLDMLKSLRSCYLHYRWTHPSWTERNVCKVLWFALSTLRMMYLSSELVSGIAETGQL